MESYQFILDVAVILIFTKTLGLISKKFNMPQVVGALLAGLILGPAFLGVIKDADFIKSVAEIGVIILMFCAGLETDINGLKKCGKASFVIAMCGVLVPLAGGFAIAYLMTDSSIIQDVFLGVILTATSVSITVETLRELGKLKSKTANAILGAAIIDDILGIIGLTIITSMADKSVNIGMVMLKIVGFFVFVAGAGVCAYLIYNKFKDKFVEKRHRYSILALAACLLMSYCAEYFFGVADITGAFFAGLIIASTERTSYIGSKFDVLSYLFFSPMFFASIGLQVELPKMSAAIIIFSILLTIVAMLTKVVGCGVGALACGYNMKRSLRIGIGMISRGEVALIVADKGAKVGLIDQDLMGPVVIVVIATTIITPLLLKLSYKTHPVPPQDIQESHYEGLEQIAKHRDTY
ncbi:MAG: cation:proton antiporter [Lachnospiraceae bacterium]|nr:cation:proton antiporter [Lachnospiraceae bacterium]